MPVPRRSAVEEPVADSSLAGPGFPGSPDCPRSPGFPDTLDYPCIPGSSLLADFGMGLQEAPELVRPNHYFEASACYQPG